MEDIFLYLIIGVILLACASISVNVYLWSRMRRLQQQQWRLSSVDALRDPITAKESNNDMISPQIAVSTTEDRFAATQSEFSGTPTRTTWLQPQRTREDFSGHGGIRYQQTESDVQSVDGSKTYRDSCTYLCSSLRIYIDCLFIISYI
jgi:hypothetical protein